MGSGLPIPISPTIWEMGDLTAKVIGCETMTVSISKKYKQCVFPVGALSSAVKNYLDFLGGDLSVEVNAEYILSGGVKKTRKMDLSELDSIVRVDSELQSIAFLYMEGYRPRVMVIILGFYDKLVLSLQSESLDDANMAAEVFSDCLSLIEKNEIIDEDFLNPKKESNSDGEGASPLEYPEKVTLKWLYHNVPYKFWFWVVFLLVTVFGLGVYFAKTPAYDLFQNL